jgi:hypothetical protein
VDFFSRSRASRPLAVITSVLVAVDLLGIFPPFFRLFGVKK